MVLEPCGAEMSDAARLCASLQSVLQRPDVWRGDRLAQTSEVISSGFPVLDAELPGGGWPRGAVTELLGDAVGVGELSLLLPVLRSCAKEGPLALLAAPFAAHAPAWAQALPLSSLLWVRASGDEVAWTAENLLASGALGALLAWLPAQTDARSLRRLQLAAEAYAAPAFLFRPATAARGASPAPLRLELAGSADGLRVKVLKRRGPPLMHSLNLQVSRPCARTRSSVVRHTFAPMQKVAVVSE